MNFLFFHGNLCYMEVRKVKKFAAFKESKGSLLCLQISVS
jgi:hypothetical protein